MSHALFGWEETNLTSTTGDDELIKECCLSLHSDGWVWNCSVSPVSWNKISSSSHSSHKPDSVFWSKNLESCSLTNIYSIWNIYFTFCFADWAQRRHVVYCQIISHCLCLLMVGLPLAVKWPPWVHSTHVHWQSPAKGWGHPQRLTSQYERVRALKWMDSISSPITFSLTHVQGDLQPCPDQAKVKG